MATAPGQIWDRRFLITIYVEIKFSPKKIKNNVEIDDCADLFSKNNVTSNYFRSTNTATAQYRICNFEGKNQFYRQKNGNNRELDQLTS